MNKRVKYIYLLAGFAIAITITALGFIEDVLPVTWDMDDIKQFHLPPPDSSVEVAYAPEVYYNSLPEHIIYKTHPVFVREFERSGYIDSLRSLTPEIAFDVQQLKTSSDWIKAGESVFNWPVAYTSVAGDTTTLQRDDFLKSKAALTPEGRTIFYEYVKTEEGKLLRGTLSCASCHTRVMPSGQVIPGAQGNVITNAGLIKAISSGKIPFPVIQQVTKQLSYAPWAPEGFKMMPRDVEELVAYFQAMRPGVVDRQGVGFLYPVTVPSLIGIKDIKYLDHTGLMKHDGPGDMMRYAAFNQGLDMLTSYDGYTPMTGKSFSSLPQPSEWRHPFGYVGKRYSDAQLYALTLYLYSLQPPENPNRFPRSLVARGQQVFIREGCVSCHTPPIYTNNKLTPANGFEPPSDHYSKYEIFNVSVETDSVSTLYSRRGTGYYKVPSLRGLWFRGVFFHNGNLANLEDVFDPRRLHADYIPTGYIPPGVDSMAVKGHPFGLEITDADRRSLIAFLKTL